MDVNITRKNENVFFSLKLQLSPPLRCDGPVEIWLNKLLMLTRYSLLDRIRQAYIQLMDVDLNIQRFLDERICQLAILGIQLVWTQDATVTIKASKENPKVMAETSANFSKLLDMLISKTTMDLSHRERTKYETLITIHLHQKDVFDDIVCSLDKFIVR